MSVSGPPSFNSASAPCVVCGAAGRACARCRVHYYCGKAHQRQHWPRHKVGCGAVALRDGLVVATVDIPADTPILRELPSLTLPGSLHSVVASQSQPFSMVNVQVGARRPAGLFAQLLCVGCCADLTRARQPAQCRRCGLPVCAATCSQSADHRVECEVFQRAKFIVPKAHFASVPLGAAVATLRAAIALPSNQLLQLLLRDQVVCEEPFKGPSPVWMANNLEVIAHVVQYLRGTVGVKWLSAEDLKRAAYMVSMFGTMSPPDDERKPAYVALVYAGMSLRKHSCIPNSAELKINKAIKECVIVTTRDVAAGEFITAFRQGGNWVDHTLDRRESLFLCWGIDCKCERCSDPTELGLYVGSPCCADCAGHGNKSYLIDAGGIWHCESCKKTMTEHEVKALTKPAKNRLHELINWYGSPPTELLKLIEDESFPRGPLHPTHAVVLHAKEAFRTAFKENGFDLVMKVGTHRWEEVIRDQLRALDRLAPGLNIWRYMMLAELRFFELGHLYELVHDRPATEENKREISRRKDAILELNRQLCRHCIEDNKLKEQFEEDPFGGCFD